MGFFWKCIRGSLVVLAVTIGFSAWAAVKAEVSVTPEGVKVTIPTFSASSSLTHTISIPNLGEYTTAMAISVERYNSLGIRNRNLHEAIIALLDAEQNNDATSAAVTAAKYRHSEAMAEAVQAQNAYHAALATEAELSRTTLVQLATALADMADTLQETQEKQQLLHQTLCNSHNYPGKHVQAMLDVCPDLLTAKQGATDSEIQQKLDELKGLGKI